MKTQNTIITLALFITGFSFGQNTFPTTGNVGIGTTTPGVAVQIEKFAPGIIDILRIKNGYATTSASHGASIVLDGYYSQSKISSYENAQNTLGGNLQLQTYNGSGVLNTGIILNRLGNVGIGTTTPSAKLESYNAVAGVTSFKAFGVNGYLLVDNLGSGENYYSANKFHDFQTAGGSSKMRINELGNVGIGTQTPAGKLDIFGGNSTATNLILSANYKDAYRWRFNTLDRGNAIDLDFTASDNLDTQEQVLKLSRSTSGRPEFQLYNNAIVANDGNVGIGTTPLVDAKLTVNGDAIFDFASYNHSSVRFGHDGNDRIIADNSPNKIYGGGYWFRVHNEAVAGKYIESMFLSDNGNVGIGVVPDAKLTVNGTIHTKEVRIDLSSPMTVPDYVFANEYQLKTLNEVHQYIKANSHLPEIPSAAEMVKNGMLVSEMNLSLLKKIEELTLYAIEQQKKLEAQHKDIEELKALVKTIVK